MISSVFAKIICYVSWVPTALAYFPMLNRASVNRDCSPIMSTLGTLCKDGWPGATFKHLTIFFVLYRIKTMFCPTLVRLVFLPIYPSVLTTLQLTILFRLQGYPILSCKTQGHLSPLLFDVLRSATTLSFQSPPLTPWPSALPMVAVPWPRATRTGH